MSAPFSPEAMAAIQAANALGLSSLRADVPQTLSEWAAEHFLLAGESSHQKGGWVGWPFQLGILDFMSDDRVEELAVKKSKRVGYTKMITAFVAYNIAHRRRKQALWQPTDDDRDSYVKSEIEPVLDGIAAVQAARRQGKGVEDTIKYKPFRDSVLHVLGGKAARAYQQAMKQPSGKSQPKPPEPENPGSYEQLVGGPFKLVFCKPWSASTDLVFDCCKGGPPGPQPTPQYLIPLLPLYMQVHHLTAHLLPSLEPVVLTDVTIAADDDSYCWSLSASGPEHLLDQLAPVGGLPARVQVTIDGITFVFAVTSTARSRSFDRRRVAVQGVSVTAMLGAPYMPRQSWLSTSVATAQQLAVAALEFSGVDLDWQIPDWQVPTGAWSFQGTPLQAVLRVAESVNAVVRSHRTAEQLIVAPRYPVLPWEWGAAVPDVQMPAAVIVTDELRPDPRADYNAIYVAGGSVGGVLGHVVRSLSARDKLAPQIQDDLITHADAARMRGSWALAASGNKLQHSISMPVLTGGTNPGILNPGQLLEVADTDGTWRGLVRGVSVSASMPRVRQQVTVERVAA